MRRSTASTQWVFKEPILGNGPIGKCSRFRSRRRPRKVKTNCSENEEPVYCIRGFGRRYPHPQVRCLRAAERRKMAFNNQSRPHMKISARAIREIGFKRRCVDAMTSETFWEIVGT